MHSGATRLDATATKLLLDSPSLHDVISKCYCRPKLALAVGPSPPPNPPPEPKPPPPPPPTSSRSTTQSWSPSTATSGIASGCVRLPHRKPDLSVSTASPSKHQWQSASPGSSSPPPSPLPPSPPPPPPPAPPPLPPKSTQSATSVSSSFVPKSTKLSFLPHQRFSH